MKGLKISVVMLVFIILLNVYFNINVKNSTSSICREITTAYSSAAEGDKTALYVSVDRIGNMLENNYIIWQLTVNHDEVDKVHTAYDRVSGCMDMDMEHICIYLRELWFYVDNIYQRERLTAYNIF